MKKAFIIFTLLLSAVCVATAQSYDLRLRLDEGATYEHKSSSTIDVTQVIQGMNLDVKTEVESRIIYRVTNADRGVYTLNVRYERVKMKVVSPMMTMEVDTADPMIVNSKDALSAAMLGLTGKDFLMRITDKGIVESTEVNKVISSMIDGMSHTFNSENEKRLMRERIDQMFGEDQMKNNFGSMMMEFPSKPVSVGDKWSGKTTIAVQSMSLEANMQYEFMGVKNGEYCVKSTAVLQTDVEDTNVGGSVSLNGTMDCQMYLNRESGWVVKNTVEQLLKGAATMTNPQNGMQMEIPISIKANTIVTGK